MRRQFGSTTWFYLLCVLSMACCLLESAVANHGLYTSSTANSSLNVRLRFSWGGGATPTSLSGSLHFRNAKIYKPVILGFNDDSSSIFLVRENQIDIKQSQKTNFEGIDIQVEGNLNSWVEIDLSDGQGNQLVQSVQLGKLFQEIAVFHLDDQENRLSISRSPGDWIQFR
ncbi:MAG: hypothetical protein AAGA30_19735, partial [Planctomycetota bacterium]